MNYNDGIDWNSQWQEHAYGYKDGHAEISFEKLGLSQAGKIVLAPGPGFGDLSHPTTKLVLSMMCGHVAGKSVLDLGSGSGILSLAAARMGAKSVIGIDIDDNAILHARHNAQLNNLPCTFAKTATDAPDILLLNMIRTEQKAAYESLPEACRHFSLAFTSGILKQEKKRYLALTESWGWKLLSERSLNGWLGFSFTIAT
ncbi:MAG: 50S ribosomal protein L11 methyltransferase [Verrucomicrobia bacterium]|nr:50S ribosomal protein L11 methyltransferase [Verrucomicrobiota bacterium]